MPVALYKRWTKLLESVDPADIEEQRRADFLNYKSGLLYVFAALKNCLIVLN